MLAELERIEAEPTGTGRKARMFRIALQGGKRTISARVEWLDGAIVEMRSPSGRALPKG
jgi:hypothetical protein